MKSENAVVACLVCINILMTAGLFVKNIAFLEGWNDFNLVYSILMATLGVFGGTMIKVQDCRSVSKSRLIGIAKLFLIISFDSFERIAKNNGRLFS
ncbi:hypothetical protein AKJ40_00680 [candidate division MSBL1 archaeon SCGC-AAA259M10]|uniref:Uncharacterized protein n=1 Tax=candidate division MSBL1 archaeon SCGC-AAA259M10 TaxID=1698270 RepID=A0A133V2W5_9EURY|nr:hypothetical protein AKJ40_00680 [candidate division MSBL1 archaeon SCGC-AAA259M10]